MRHRAWLTPALGLVFVAALVAQQQEAPPVFRSAIEAVQMDVFVTDAAGNPVSGLTIDDFELVEDGKPQPITTFEAVHIPSERASAAEHLAEPDVLTNETPMGRAYVFAIDDLDGCAALRTRGYLRQFMDEFFGPHDIAAVALVGRGLATDGQDFTGNRRLLLDAIGKISGEGAACVSHPRILDAHKSPRSQQIASLRDLIESLARIPGRHKAMLFFTHGPQIDMVDLVDYNGGVLGMAGADAHGAMLAATRSNLRIYPIDPAGLGPGGIPLAQIASMRALGQITGGFALVNSNSFTETFERIVRDNSVYYMLGFNSEREKIDGRYVRVQVRVTRPGLSVRAREGYVAPTREEQRVRDKAQPPATGVAATLASPLTTAGIPMRVTAAPFKGTGRNARVALALELDVRALDLEEAEDGFEGMLDIRYIATSANKRVSPETRHVGRVELRSEAYTMALKTGLRLVSYMDLPEGRHQIRVASGNGIRTGSVVYDLEVPDFAGAPLTMSGISVAYDGAARTPTLGLDGLLLDGKSPRCRTPCNLELTRWTPSDIVADGHPLFRATPAPPTTVREFTQGDTLQLFAEVYDNNRRVARDPEYTITVTVSLRDAGGQVARDVSFERPSRTPRRPSGGHGFSMQLPLEDVPAGPYVLQIDARSTRDPKHAAGRSIPVRVR